MAAVDSIALFTSGIVHAYYFIRICLVFIVYVYLPVLDRRRSTFFVSDVHGRVRSCNIVNTGHSFCFVFVQLFACCICFYVIKLFNGPFKYFYFRVRVRLGLQFQDQVA